MLSMGPHPMLGLPPGPLEPLADLVCDLHWSWSHVTDSLWAEIEPRA